MKRKIAAVLTLFIFGCLEAAVELAYLPNQPVLQESRLHVQLTLNGPDGSFKIAMEQKLEALLVLSGEAGLPLSQGPFDLQFTLRKCAIDLNAGDASFSFNAKNPGTSLFLAQISEILDKPIKLHFDENQRLRSDTAGIRQLAKEFPFLGEIHSRELIDELFQHLFALAGKPLALGSKFVLSPAQEGVGLSPQEVVYEIDAIEKEWIHAKIAEEIHPLNLPLDTKFKIEESDQPLTLQLSGSMNGESKWSRKNALIYEAATATQYKGTAAAAGNEWSLLLTIDHDLAAYPWLERSAP